MEYLVTLLEKCDAQVVIYSLLIGIALGLLIWALVTCELKNRHECHTIEIEDSEKGNFSISSSAMAMFVTNIVKNNSNLTFKKLKIVDTRAGLNLNITLSALPDAELLSNRKELRDEIFKELESKLGIADKIKQINFEIDAFEQPNESGANMANA